MTQVTNVGRTGDPRPDIRSAHAFGDAAGRIETVDVKAETPLPGASVTKAMLATAVVKLAADGILDLDDPLVKSLPPESGLSSDPTWLQVLTHTGRFPFEFRPDWWDPTPMSNAELLTAMTRTRPLPSGLWHYSNAGYQAVAITVESVTSLRWDQVVSDALWSPAGMTNTHVPTAGTPESTAHHAAGGVVTTLEDLCRFGAVLAGHRPDVLSSPALEVLTAPRAVAAPDVLQAAGVQLSGGDRTRILTWGTIEDHTIGLMVEPGLHSVAVRVPGFAQGERVRNELAELSNILRDQIIDNALGLWWLDGAQVEVNVSGGILVIRDPHSPVCLVQVSVDDATIGETRIELPGLMLWREMQDSAWQS